MIDRINGRIAALLAACAFLVVVLVGWYAFVSPQRSKAASLDSQIGTLQGQIASTQAYLSNPTTKGYKGQLRRLELAIPANVQMSEILRQLSWAASRAKISINAITPGALVPSAGGQAVPINLSVEGHYFRLATFLHLLRTRVSVRGEHVKVAGRLYTVDGIGFNENSGSIINATVSLNAFVSTPAPAPPPTTTTTTATG